MNSQLNDAGAQQSVLNDGRPELDLRAFRKCLGQFGTGVTVMATRFDGQLVGSTIGSFASLSLDPPLVLWSISRSSRSFSSFQQASHFTINVLAERQIDLSQRFGSSVDDKFAGVQWREANNGCPVLPGIVALFECKLQATYDGGDHLIIVGKVDRFIRYSGKPLLFVQSEYSVAQTHPQIQSLASGSSTASRELGGEARLSTMLHDAARLRVEGFEKYRRAEGVNYLQSLLLFEACGKPGQTIAQLSAQVFSVPEDCAHAVADLVHRHLLLQDHTGGVAPTQAGLEKRDAIQARHLQYEADCLMGFSSDQLTVVRDFLNTFILKFDDAGSAWTRREQMRNLQGSHE